jgi:2'-5' RNA ligase
MEASHSSGFLRLFIAIPVPEAVRAEIARAQGRLKRESPLGSVRWARPDQFHITLKFLGDVPVTQVDDLKKSVADVCAAAPALQLSARGIGFFPNELSPRVIWAGAHDDRGTLSDLHRMLDEALRCLEPKGKTEKFTGHITLGRFKPGHHATIPRIVNQAEFFRGRHFGDWRAGEVEIMRSDLTANGANHTSLASYSLTQNLGYL